LHFDAAEGVVKHFGHADSEGKSWHPGECMDFLGATLDLNREALYLTELGRGPVCSQIRAVLLANVFCGVLWCFAGVLWCFAGVLRLRCFARGLQYFQKTHKTPEKHRKTLKKKEKLTIRSCIAGVFHFQVPRAKKIDCIAQNTFHKHICETPQNTAKHKTPQNSHKTRFVFCEITSQNTVKRTQNAQANVTKRSQYSRNACCAHSVFSPKIR